MFKTYRNRKIRTRLRFFVVEARPYVAGEDLASIDTRSLSPQAGDMVVRQRDEHAQTWLAARKDFDETYEVIP